MDTKLLRMVDVFLEGSRKPLIVVLGPTASGKTALSIDIAKHVGGMVVNADSRQLYRYLDIGTAKITAEEMEGVPHYLLDVKDPGEEITVGWYQEEALKAICGIHARRGVPLLVGGSMLYISSVVDGLTLAPAADPSLRRRLEAAYDEDGGRRLYGLLRRVDPDAAATIHSNNRPSVIRAVEIYGALKRPKSAVVGRQRCSYDLLLLGTECSREDLLRRIGERTGWMLENGWLEEVRGLLARGYTADDPGLKSHGYREVIRYIGEVEHGGFDVDADTALQLLKRRIVVKTRQYAKRQLTWWRNDQRIHWLTYDDVACRP